MRAPAFQFYAADYLADEAVTLMSLEAEGVYTRLLAYCWREGSIPANALQLSRLCKGAAIETIEEVLPCFYPDPDNPSRLLNKRLEGEREKQEQHRLKQAENGKRGGRPPKPTENPSETQNKAVGFTEETQQQSQDEPKKSSSFSSSFSSSSSDKINSTSTTGDGEKLESPEKKYKRFCVLDQPEFTPPSTVEVLEYFTQQECPNAAPEAENFHFKYSAFEWLRDNGYFMFDWKSSALAWISSVKGRHSKNTAHQGKRLEPQMLPKAPTSYAEMARKQQNQIDR